MSSEPGKAFQIIGEMDGPSVCFCVGPQVGETLCPCALNKVRALTPARGEPMPKTIEHYQANALRDQELIMEQKDEIAKQSQTINDLRQKLESRK